LGLLLRKKTASAFILLDELDKVGHRYSNGPALDAALLGLLEPETASRWRDGFLQAECDLSRVTFWATANSLTRISRPLLSRFEIVHVPEPGPQHVQRLADSMIAQLETDWGLSPGVLPRRTIALPRGQRVNARELRTYLQRALAEWCRSEFTERRLH
jgi:ATP-dependent Lon protease